MRAWLKMHDQMRPMKCKGRYTRGNLLPQHAPATRSRSKAPSSAPTISSEKICCATKLLLPSFAPSYQTGLIWGSKLPGQICCMILFQEQAPSCELKFALREHVSGASFFVCTGWGTYPGACFGSVFQEQAPSCVGGSVAEWLGRRTWNPEVAGSSTALTTKLELFLGGPQFHSSVMLVNSQLVCLPPVGIFNPVMFIWNICFLQFEWHVCELAWCS